MRARFCFVIWLCLLGCGCGKAKSDIELIDDLKSADKGARLIAVRLLAQRKDVAQIIPALIECLKDKESDVRIRAAIALGAFRDQAMDAVPALQAAERDGDARVREAAGVALSRIDPERFAAPTKGRIPGTKS